MTKQTEVLYGVHNVKSDYVSITPFDRVYEVASSVANNAGDEIIVYRLVPLRVYSRSAAQFTEIVADTVENRLPKSKPLKIKVPIKAKKKRGAK